MTALVNTFRKSLDRKLLIQDKNGDRIEASDRPFQEAIEGDRHILWLRTTGISGAYMTRGDVRELRSVLDQILEDAGAG